MSSVKVTARKQVRDDRAARLERRLALPVVIAALVSVPATFLTAVAGWPGQVGKVLNWGVSAVLTGEPLLLFLLTGRRLAWVRAHLWPLLIAGVAIPAALLAVLPVQALRLLRLVHLVTAVRLLRVNRILGAADTLRRFLHVGMFWRRVTALGGPIIAFGFAGFVLADPQSRTRQVLSTMSDHFGLVPVICVVALVIVTLAATFRYLQRLLTARIRQLAAAFALRRQEAEAPAPLPVDAAG
jgi:hypothetical protein